MWLACPPAIKCSKLCPDPQDQSKGVCNPRATSDLPIDVAGKADRSGHPIVREWRPDRRVAVLQHSCGDLLDDHPRRQHYGVAHLQRELAQPAHGLRLLAEDLAEQVVVQAATVQSLQETRQPSVRELSEGGALLLAELRLGIFEGLGFALPGGDESLQPPRVSSAASG